MSKLNIYLLGIILTCHLFSCDPGHGVILQNNSTKTVEVQILTSPHSTSYKSVVFVIDSIATNFGQEARPIEMTMDSVDYTRVFSLSPNQSVMFDYGISTLDFKQRLVIDETDTLDFKDKNRLNVGGNYMSKLYVFSVLSKAPKLQ